MRILLVEDQEEKADDITSLLNNSLLSPDIVRAKSFNSAQNCLEDFDFDLVLLDMTLPLVDGDSELEADGVMLGCEVIEEIAFRELDVQIIVVSGYKVFESDYSDSSLEEIVAKYKKKYPSLLRKGILYRLKHDDRIELRDEVYQVESEIYD